ncbi:MAG TPA: response regulator transcription factor [Gemmatimonadales bacterium]|jgi:DNA-binding response OmpR family regulator
MRILLVDDDPTIVLLARRLLEESGCVVVVADTLEAARARVLIDEFDGVVLDLELPDGNGVTLVQELRTAGRKTPILILTGTRRHETLVRALDAGADDYVNKPIVFDEFQARVRALVRRGGAKHAEQLAAGNVLLHRITRDVLVGGKKLDLTPRELTLLEQLMLKAGQVVTRKELLADVMDMAFDPGTNVLDVNVSRLRKKLKDRAATVQIVARRGLGFVLSAEPAKR